MEKDDKGSTLIRIGVRGESSFWYRPTRVVPDQRPLNGRCCCCCCIGKTASGIQVKDANFGFSVSPNSTEALAR